MEKSSSKLRRPCSNCPWRVDAPRQHWDPEHFRQIWRNCQDDGANMMLCHKANQMPEVEAKKLVCQGWVRVMKEASIGVRLALLLGLVSPEEMLDTGGPELFKTFRAMLLANDVRPPPRNRFVRRRP